MINLKKYVTNCVNQKNGLQNTLNQSDKDIQINILIL